MVLQAINMRILVILFCGVSLASTIPYNVINTDTSNTKSRGSFVDEPIYEDCLDARRKGESVSGIYWVKPKFLTGVTPFYVSCDMKTDGGGWLVFQRRQDGSFNFQRDWQNYVDGFGGLGGELWLGNKKIYQLTSQKRYALRVDMRDDRNDSRYAEYDDFKVADEHDKYRLHIGSYKGNAGDSLTLHTNQTFKTTGYCARTYKGAWWYANCHHSNLNGRYLNGNHTSKSDGINWYSFRGYYNSLLFTEMKMRPVLPSGTLP